MSQIFKQHRSVESFWITPEWLGNRMVFLSGPRQVGKTTLATTTLCKSKESYFNWDSRTVRLAYQKDPDFFAESDAPWICFDEIHKRPRWKDILKGIYDQHQDRFRFLVTGSARLDLFKKSGDSLVGRYFHTQLFPLNLGDFRKEDFDLPQSAGELIGQALDTSEAKSLEDLLHWGGFPEPFYKGSESFWRRWSANHSELILSEDLRDLSRVVEVDKLSFLVEMLAPSIGQTVSYNSLAQDLETTHSSVKRWLSVLSKLQLIFSVGPYSKNVRRAFKVEKKWYFVDWRQAGTAVFENYVATSLLRAVTLYTDRFGDKMSLYFVRTHDGAEVDFLICRESKPWLLIEAKQGTAEISSAAYRFSHELKVPCVVVTRKKNIAKKTTGKNDQKIFYISWSKLGSVLP